MGENARNLRKPIRGLMFLLLIYLYNTNNNNRYTTYKYLKHYSTTAIAKQEKVKNIFFAI